MENTSDSDVKVIGLGRSMLKSSTLAALALTVTAFNTAPSQPEALPYKVPNGYSPGGNDRATKPNKVRTKNKNRVKAKIAYKSRVAQRKKR